MNFAFWKIRSLTNRSFRLIVFCISFLLVGLFALISGQFSIDVSRHATPSLQAVNLVDVASDNKTKIVNDFAENFTNESITEQKKFTYDLFLISALYKAFSINGNLDATQSAAGQKSLIPDADQDGVHVKEYLEYLFSLSSKSLFDWNTTVNEFKLYSWAEASAGGIESEIKTFLNGNTFSHEETGLMINLWNSRNETITTDREFNGFSEYMDAIKKIKNNYIHADFDLYLISLAALNNDLLKTLPSFGSLNTLRLIQAENYNFIRRFVTPTSNTDSENDFTLDGASFGLTEKNKIVVRNFAASSAADSPDDMYKRASYLHDYYQANQIIPNTINLRGKILLLLTTVMTAPVNKSIVWSLGMLSALTEIETLEDLNVINLKNSNWDRVKQAYLNYSESPNIKPLLAKLPASSKSTINKLSAIANKLAGGPSEITSIEIFLSYRLTNIELVGLVTLFEETSKSDSGNEPNGLASSLQQLTNELIKPSNGIFGRIYGANIMKFYLKHQATLPKKTVTTINVVDGEEDETVKTDAYTTALNNYFFRDFTTHETKNTIDGHGSFGYNAATQQLWLATSKITLDDPFADQSAYLSQFNFFSDFIKVLNIDKSPLGKVFVDLITPHYFNLRKTILIILAILAGVLALGFVGYFCQRKYGDPLKRFHKSKQLTSGSKEKIN